MNQMCPRKFWQSYALSKLLAEEVEIELLASEQLEEYATLRKDFLERKEQQLKLDARQRPQISFATFFGSLSQYLIEPLIKVG